MTDAKGRTLATRAREAGFDPGGDWDETVHRVFESLSDAEKAIHEAHQRLREAARLLNDSPHLLIAAQVGIGAETAEALLFSIRSLRSRANTHAAIDARRDREAAHG